MATHEAERGPGALSPGAERVWVEDLADELAGGQKKRVLVRGIVIDMKEPRACSQCGGPIYRAVVDDGSGAIEAWLPHEVVYRAEQQAEPGAVRDALADKWIARPVEVVGVARSTDGLRMLAESFASLEFEKVG